MSWKASWNYRVGIVRGEAPPDDGAIGSAGVERRRMVEHGGGRDSVRRKRFRPYARHGSALHDSVSRGESGSHERVTKRERASSILQVEKA